ncbi:ankyrin repeat domain-containing protein 13C [Planococcus citri]|uniref:ankyrin repeat domain-containing protein 13C n=1 Tax=Planococcus citri TaxID=170843 RepID=UPI0031F945C4
MAEDQQYPLHECVFSGDLRKLSALLRSDNDIAKKDKHGNTALHLAVMLGKKECVHLLLAHNAPVKVKNLAGWSPLSEAISYGDRQTILSLLRKFKQQLRDTMGERRPNLLAGLNKMQDFYMELKWDFHSWLPLVSRLLPSDLCRIQKHGSSIRFDSTLVDFNDMKWERGDITFLFNGTAPPNESLIIMDNVARVYQRIRHEETECEIEDEVDNLMSNDIMSAQMSTKSITFTRAQSGWIFKEDKHEMVGPFNSDYYIVNGMVLESRKRREHLSEEDLQKNKALIETFTRGHSQATNGSPEQTPVRRESLPPPPPCNISWEEYINCEPGKYANLGRPMVLKESARAYKATVAMSSDFPLSVEMLLSVLEVIAPFKHSTKLKKFVQMKLPPGFPVKLDIPILPTVSAKVTFQQFRFLDDVPEHLFEIPTDYREDPDRFPDL